MLNIFYLYARIINNNIHSLLQSVTFMFFLMVSLSTVNVLSEISNEAVLLLLPFASATT